MHPAKYIWAFRGLIAKISFKHFGNMSYMGKPCFIEGKKNIEIGSKTRIFPGIRMEAIGEGTIHIGNNCVFEQNVHIISMGNDLIIGDNVTIAPNVFITNVNHEYQDVAKSVMDQGNIVKKTIINDGCFIGFGAAIQAGAVLGKHCVVGSNAVVSGVFPDYCVIVGVPGKIIKQYDEITKTWKRIK